MRGRSLPAALAVLTAATFGLIVFKAADGGVLLPQASGGSPGAVVTASLHPSSPGSAGPVGSTSHVSTLGSVPGVDTGGGSTGNAQQVSLPLPGHTGAAPGPGGGPSAPVSSSSPAGPSSVPTAPAPTASSPHPTPSPTASSTAPVTVLAGVGKVVTDIGKVVVIVATDVL